MIYVGYVIVLIELLRRLPIYLSICPNASAGCIGKENIIGNV